jgi:hypothetical protein
VGVGKKPAQVVMAGLEADEELVTARNVGVA